MTYVGPGPQAGPAGRLPGDPARQAAGALGEPGDSATLALDHDPRTSAVHPVGRLVQALVAPDRRRLARVSLVVLVLAGLSTLRSPILALAPPYVYQREVKTDYLLWRAVLDGVSPYLDLPRLTERYLPAATPHVATHPVPHPPTVAVLLAPLGLLSYEVVSAVWLAVDLLSLLATVYLVATTWRQRPPLACVGVGFAILLLWEPVVTELLLGQWSAPLAALLMGCWVAYRAGRARLAGVLLGAAIAVKLVPAFVASYFLVARVPRRWTVLASAAATVITATIVSTLVLGLGEMRGYLLEALPSNVFWRAAEANYSLVSPIWRALAGSQAMAPLADLPALASALATLVTLVVLVSAGRAAARADDPDVGFALALCAMLLVSPTVWQHYFIVLVWPLWVIGRRIHAAGWERKRTNLYLVVPALLAVPPAPVFWLVRQLAAHVSAGATPDRLPAVAGLPLLVFPLAPLLTFSLLLSLAQREHPRPMPRPKRGGHPGPHAGSAAAVAARREHDTGVDEEG